MGYWFYKKNIWALENVFMKNAMRTLSYETNVDVRKHNILLTVQQDTSLGPNLD